MLVRWQTGRESDRATSYWNHNMTSAEKQSRPSERALLSVSGHSTVVVHRSQLLLHFSIVGGEMIYKLVQNGKMVSQLCVLASLAPSPLQSLRHLSANTSCLRFAHMLISNMTTNVHAWLGHTTLSKLLQLFD